jgi:hypothetical protein
MQVFELHSCEQILIKNCSGIDFKFYNCKNIELDESSVFLNTRFYCNTSNIYGENITFNYDNNILKLLDLQIDSSNIPTKIYDDAFIFSFDNSKCFLNSKSKFFMYQ